MFSFQVWSWSNAKHNRCTSTSSWKLASLRWHNDPGTYVLNVFSTFKFFPMNLWRKIRWSVIWEKFIQFTYLFHLFIYFTRSYWKGKDKQVKRSRIDVPSSSVLFSQDKASLVSFEVTWMIAKWKNPHNIRGERGKEVAKAIVKTIYGTNTAKQIWSLPLSYNTIKRRIDFSLYYVLF